MSLLLVFLASQIDFLTLDIVPDMNPQQKRINNYEESIAQNQKYNLSDLKDWELSSIKGLTYNAQATLIATKVQILLEASQGKDPVKILTLIKGIGTKKAQKILQSVLLK